MTDMEFMAAELRLRYGAVRRARGCFLYTQNGVRLVDLFQESGRAILGWGTGTSFTVFKNSLSRGYTGSCSTDALARLSKAVERLLDSPRKVILFTQKQEALRAGLSVAPNSTAVWKPWLSCAPDWALVDAVLVEPPLPWTAGLYVLAFRCTPELESAVAVLGVPASVPVAAPLLVAAARAIDDMRAALNARCEHDWFLYDRVLSAYWKRGGPYLHPSVEAGHYRSFFCHCLDCGVLISPVYEQPSIVPFGANCGVFSALKKNPFEPEHCTAESGRTRRAGTEEPQ